MRDIVLRRFPKLNAPSMFTMAYKNLVLYNCEAEHRPDCPRSPTFGRVFPTVPGEVYWQVRLRYWTVINSAEIDAEFLFQSCETGTSLFSVT